MRTVIHALLMLLWAGPVAAANYPTKPVRLLVGFASGGAVDTTARIVSQRLTEVWGQQVIVENRSGGGGTIAVNTVANATPDGYTLLVAANAEIAANPVLFPGSAINPIKDLAPISLISMTPFLIVTHPGAAINSLEDLIAQAKARPGQITWASAGHGSTNHFTGSWFASEAGIKLLHVPYKGAAPAAAAVAGGEVAIGIVSPTAGLPFISSGRIKVLALTTKYKPTFAKDWPTAAEKGVSGFDSAAWIGLFAPASTPRELLTRLNGEINKLLKEPDVQKRFAVLGFESLGTTSADFIQRVKNDLVLYARIAREADIRPQ